LSKTVLAALHIEEEVADIAVLDDVILALGQHLAALFGGMLGTGLDEIVELNDLHPDKAALDVAMDLAARHRGGRAFADRPGPAFVFAGRIEGHQPQIQKCKQNESFRKITRRSIPRTMITWQPQQAPAVNSIDE
jgi:hypothetical protein